MRRLTSTLLTAWALSAPSTPTFAVQPLARLNYQIVGSELRVSPPMLSVPKGIAGSVLVAMTDGDGRTNATDVVLVNAHFEAILRGPSFAARRIVGRPNEALLLPPLNLVGDYQLDNVRLVDDVTGATRREATPSSIPVHVFEEVLVSHVTSRPLTTDEIKDKGIVIDQSNFRAVEFEVMFALEGKQIPIKFPVVSPTFHQSTDLVPAAEQQARLVAAQQINNEIAQNHFQTVSLPKELDRPGLNIQIRGVNFQVAVAEEEDLHVKLPALPAVMIIPGNVGYLNQFFSVQIFTENGAPVGSGLSVHSIQAALQLPPGRDGILSTNFAAPGDDPLRFARVGPDKEILKVLQIIGPLPDKRSRFLPGQGGSAEFLVEGLLEGLHLMDINLTADLDGLAAGSVRINGKAAGSVLVRNPKFSMAFSHPKTVRAGEPYTARVTILNTGGSQANLVSVSIRGAGISGAVLESAETVQMGDLGPGQSATAVYRLRAQRSGAIRFSNLTTSEESLAGRFNMTIGVDERGVELSPDSLVLPDFVNALPGQILDAANRILGQALSVATAPLRPNGVTPVPRGMITRRALELAEAGQRLTYGDATNRVLVDLMLDWQGGREFDPGFDQILRETDAGREWRTAAAKVLELSDTRDATARFLDRAPDIAGRSEPWVVATSSAGTLEVGVSHPNGSSTLERSTLQQALSYRGTAGHWLFGQTSGGIVKWEAKANVASADLAVVAFGTNGVGRQWRWAVTDVPIGACLSFDLARNADLLSIDTTCDGSTDLTVAAAVSSVTELPPQLIAVMQDTTVELLRPLTRCTPGLANNYGHVVSVLFSKPMTAESVNVPAAYRLDSGVSASGVRLQPGGRVALLALEEGISALHPRQLQVVGIQDQRGNEVSEGIKSIQSTFRDGITVRGRVVRADGDPAAGLPVTLTMDDRHRDPFDQCDPVVSRVAQKFTDVNGYFAFDFVHYGVNFTIGTVDTGGLTPEAVNSLMGSFSGDRFSRERLVAQVTQSNLLTSAGVATADAAIALAEGLDRAVWQDRIDANSGRVGHELVVALRFRGRGTVQGQVVAEDGVTPIPRAAVNLYPDPSSRELGRGVFTDAGGRFQFNGVPLGIFGLTVETSQRQYRAISEVLGKVHEVKDLRVQMLPVTPQMIVRTTIRGRVFESDNATRSPGAVVVVRDFEGHVIAVVTADDDGQWEAANIPLSFYALQVVSRDRRRSAQLRFAGQSSTVVYGDATLSGTGEVRVQVVTSTGEAVTNALVAGGLTLERTDRQGFALLTGVPLGRRGIEAGIEAEFSPWGIAKRASTTVNVLPSVLNGVTLQFPASGQVEGVVINTAGQPVSQVTVAINTFGGFFWTRADENGRYRFENLPLGKYTVVAPSPPVVTAGVDDLANQVKSREDLEGAADQLAAGLVSAVTTYVRRIDPSATSSFSDNSDQHAGSFGLAPAVLTHDQQTVQADIRYTAQGRISGRVLNHQGVPIGARLLATGMGIRDDATVGLKVVGRGTSDSASGLFSITGVPEGDWNLEVASPFYPRPIKASGRTTPAARDVTNLVMQFAASEVVARVGRVAGQVLNPDGAPVSSNVLVRIPWKPGYEIRTETNGFFDTQVGIPTGGYPVEAIDLQTGLRGLAWVGVSAGITNFITVNLLGKGNLEMEVLLANGSPATNAEISVRGGQYPHDLFNGLTDALGRLRVTNAFAGNYAAYAKYRAGVSTLEGSVGFGVMSGASTTNTIRLGPSGCVMGRFVHREDGTPVTAARISLTAPYAVYPYSVTSTDTNGAFELRGIRLGSYRVIAVDPVTGRVGLAPVEIHFDGEIVQVLVMEQPQGTLDGRIFKADRVDPIAGARVEYVPSDGVAFRRTVTTDINGLYSFPGVTPGGFYLSVDGAGKHTIRYGVFPEGAPTMTLDATLPPDPILGKIALHIFESDGVTPARRSALLNCFNCFADTNGIYTLSDLNYGFGARTFGARSTVGGQENSLGFVSVFFRDNAPNLETNIVLSGVGRVEGRIVQGDGVTPVGDAEIRCTAQTEFVDYNIVQFSAPNGTFVFSNLPVAGFRLVGRKESQAASESDVIKFGGHVVTKTLRFNASGSIAGRVVRGDGSTVVQNGEVSVTFKAPSGRDGFDLTHTTDQGRFRFDDIPVGDFSLIAAFSGGNGLAKLAGKLSANGQILDLGDIRLDEDWPYVYAISPANESVDVSVNVGIDVTMSEAIKPESVKTSGIFLLGNGVRVASTVSLIPDLDGIRRVLRVVPSARLKSLTSYQLLVYDGKHGDGEGPTDLVDRPLLAPFIATFRTRDEDPPQLLSISPTNGLVQVDPRAVIRLSFNEPIRSSNVDFTITGPGGTIAARVDVGLNGNALVLTPTVPLPANSTFQYSISGIRDLAGNQLPNQPVRGVFATLDTVGPEIATLRVAQGQRPIAGRRLLVESILKSGETGVQVRYSADLNPFGIATNPPYSTPITLPLIGTTTIRAFAVDRFGNQGPLAELPVAVVANQAPSLQLTRVSPASGPIASGSAFTVNLTVTDDAEAASVTVVGSGVEPSTLVVSNLLNTNVTFRLPNSAVPGVPVRIRAQAVDHLGLVSSEEQLVLTPVDRSPPALALLSPIGPIDPREPLRVVVSSLENSERIALNVVLSGAILGSQTSEVVSLANQSNLTEFTFPLVGVPLGGASQPLIVSLTAVDSETNTTSLQRSFPLRDLVPPYLTSVRVRGGGLGFDTPKMPLWETSVRYEASEFVFFNPPGAFRWTNDLGGSLGRLNGSYNGYFNEMFQDREPLVPGARYAAVVFPGIKDIGGNELLDTSMKPIPSGGFPIYFETAAIRGFSPAAETPVFGGTLLPVRIDFDSELGADLFQFRINSGQWYDVSQPRYGRTNVVAEVPIPLDAGDVVLQVRAYTASGSPLYVPYVFPPSHLRFMGNDTNQAPVARLERVAPASGSVLLGQSFSLRVTATDDRQLTNVTLVGAGSFSFTRSFAVSGKLSSLLFITNAPVDTPLERPFQISAFATDIFGKRSGDATVCMDLSPVSGAALPRPLLAISSVQETNVLVSFNTTPGYPYYLEAKDDLGAAHWFSFGAIIGDGLNQSLMEQMETNRFYRVRVR